MNETESQPPSTPDENDVAQSETKPLSALVFVVAIVIIAVVASLVIFVISLNGNFMAEETVISIDTEEVPFVEAESQRVLEVIGEYDSSVLAINDLEYIGPHFTRPEDGLTLYVLIGEECSAECDPNMIPYTTDAPYSTDNQSEIAQSLSSVEIASSTHQYTWQGKKLHTYRADQNPGDFLGDGLDDEWTLARP